MSMTMRRSFSLIALALLTPALGGCVRTVGSVVTAPVRAAGWGVDKMTTSQSESDRNYGRKMRKEEEKRAREERKRAKQQQREQDDR